MGLSIIKLPSQEDLKYLLDYDSITGIFKWKTKPTQRINVGTIAGYKNTTYGYTNLRIDKKSYQAHRLAWKYYYGIDPEKFIDHINGDKSDNRICNLREATSLENNRNTEKNSNNTSGFKGVSYHKRIGKWQARSSMNGKRIHLGYFDIPEEASITYINFTKLTFKEFYKDVS